MSDNTICVWRTDEISIGHHSEPEEGSIFKRQNWSWWDLWVCGSLDHVFQFKSLGDLGKSNSTLRKEE